MAKYSIYSKDGVLKAEACPTYTGTYMQPGVLDFREIGTPLSIEWEVGDYVDYDRTGFRYRLYQQPQTKRQARRRSYGAALAYQNVQFFDDSYQLKICPFRDLIVGDNRTHFTTQPQISVFDDVAGIAERLQVCLEDMYGSGSWVVRVATLADGISGDLNTLLQEEKEFVVSGVNILEALDKVYELWPEVGWVYKIEEVNGTPTNTIVIGGGGLNTQINVYAYGKGNGLTSLQRTVANADELANRLYVYGSSQNMLPKWYNNQNIKNAASVDIQHLMLPVSTWGVTDGLPDPAKAYVGVGDDDIEPGELRPKTVYFDGTGDLGDIHPTIKGLTAGELREVMPAGTQYRPTNVYDDEDALDVLLSAQNPVDSGLAGDVYGKGATQTGTHNISATNSGTVGADETLTDEISVDTFTVDSADAYNLEVNFYPTGTITGSLQGVRLKVEVLVGSRKVTEGQISLKGSSSWTPEGFQLSVPGITIAASASIAVHSEIVLDNKGGESAVEVSFTLGGTVGFKLSKSRALTFSVVIPQIGFDIDEQAALGDGKTIAFTSGACAGRTFAIQSASYLSDSDSWRLELVRSEDESLSQWFPNSSAQLAAGNHFVLLDIAMPGVLINVAEQRLLAAAQSLLAYTSKEVWQYTPEIDAKFMQENNRLILPAEYIALTDDDMFAYASLSYFVESGGAYYLTEQGEKILLDGDHITEPVLVDSVTISEGDAQIRTYKVTLRDRKKKKYTEYAEVQSSSSSRPVTSTQEGVASSATQVSSYFEEDGDGGIKLKDEYNGFWAAGFVSAGGQGQGGGGGTGISLLEVWRSLTNNAELSDYDNDTQIAVAHIPNITTGKISNLSSWVGSNAITTLGTITTGVWNGTAISIAKGGTGMTAAPAAQSVIVSDGSALYGLAPNLTTTKKFLTQTGAGASFAAVAPVWSELSINDFSISGDAYSMMFLNGNSQIAALAPNLTTTKKFLTQTGNGTSFSSNTPAWGTISASDISVTGEDYSLIFINGSSVMAALAPNMTTTKQFLAQTGNGTGFSPNSPVWSTLSVGDIGSSADSYSIVIVGGSNTLATVSPNTATTKKYLTQTGNGSSFASNSPAWSTLNIADIIGSTAIGSTSQPIYYTGSAFSGVTAISNNYLANSKITILGSDVSLGGSISTFSGAGTFNGAITINNSLQVGNSSSGNHIYLYGGLFFNGDTVKLHYQQSANALHTNVGLYSDTFLDSGGLYSSSDRRLKKNLKDITLTIQQIADAPAVEFDWVDESKGKGAGSIAQYWEDYLPYNVRNSSKGKSIEYGNIALISAISIARTIQNHEQRIASLERRIGK